MKETGILFKPEMIRAILDGRKTQTRRLIKFKNPRADCIWCYGKGFEYIDCQNEYSGYDYRKPCRCCWSKCPHGRKGDLLYVKEGFVLNYSDDIRIAYKTDWHGAITEYASPPKWTSPLFMPKKYARIWLELVADPIPQRLRDISEEDAFAEGISEFFKNGLACAQFACLWESINGAGTWKKNPWVWKLEFKRIER